MVHGRVWRGAALLCAAGAAVAGLTAPPAGANAAPEPATATPAIKAGAFYNLLLANDGSVWSWASNNFGVLGTTPAGVNRAAPAKIDGLTDIVAISADEYHNLLLHADGTVSALGSNQWGQLGTTTDNGTTNAHATPETVGGIGNAVAVDAGAYHSAVLDADGDVWMFGDNYFGQLGSATGNGVATAHPTATKVAGLSDITAVSAGGWHTLALRKDGTVWAFGENDQGQLGMAADGAAHPAPSPVAGLSDIMAIAAGQSWSMALKADGTVWTWGDNGVQQTGQPAGPDVTTATMLSGLTDVTAVSADEVNGIALKSDGTVWGWGDAFYTQIGTTGGAPHAINGLTNVVSIAMGQRHSAYLDRDGKVLTLGENGSGQLGSASPSSTSTPLEVSGVTAPRVAATSTAARRLVDTRAGGTTVDGTDAGDGARATGTTMELTVTGRAGIPATATAVALNLTVTNPTGTGFVVAYPCGASRPLVSNLNYRAGQTVANLAVVKIGTGGKVCIYNEGASAELVVDIDRYQPAGAGFSPLTPARLYDSRSDGTTIDGLEQHTGSRAAGTTTEVTVGGRGGVAATDKAAVLNVTVTNAAGAAFVTVYPCGGSRPLASNLNVTAGATVANVAIAKLGTGGKVCIYNEGGALDLVVDVTGAYPTSATLTSLTPARLLDTRATGTTVDGVGQAGGAQGTGSVTEISVLGRGGVPFNADQVVLNVTATEGSSLGFVTVYPCGTDRQLTSNLNYSAGSTVANVVITRVGNAGKVCLYSEGGSTHLVVDVSGYIAS